MNIRNLLNEVIKKEKSKWVLYDKKGIKKLGTHKTKKEAKSQEIAINISKAKKRNDYV